MKRSLLLCTIAALSALATPILHAQTGDAPPLDVNQLLQELKKIREQNDAGIKARRNKALQSITAASGSPTAAVTFWKDAVRNTQFEGADKESQKLADWRESDGEALKDPICQGAVQLHLRWLALSLRYSNGEDMRVLLPLVIDYTKALQQDMTAADRLVEQLDKEKEKNDGKHGMQKKGTAEDGAVKKVHEQIMRMAVGGSPVARWLQLSDLLGDSGKKQKGGGTGNGWEATPGNFDGIYNSIILPVFRENKDPRLLEYWDVVIKREGDKITSHSLDVDQRDWTQVKYPSLRWQRSQDVLLIGYKNRAILEMFNLVKSFPQHPDFGTWVSTLESTLVPSTAPYGSAALTTPGAIPAGTTTGSVPPPVAVPPATGGNVPTATLLPTPGVAPTPGVRR